MPQNNSQENNRSALANNHSAALPILAAQRNIFAAVLPKRSAQGNISDAVLPEFEAQENYHAAVLPELAAGVNIFAAATNNDSNACCYCNRNIAILKEGWGLVAGDGERFVSEMVQLFQDFSLFLAPKIKLQVKVYTDIETFAAVNPVVTLGTFDGVHNGHKKVIARLKELARELNGESVIFTFSPHPRQVLHPGQGNLRLLTTLDEKIKLFEQAGIDHLVAFPFTREFSKLSYSDFVKDILLDKLGMHCLVVGYDHKFGRNREGSYEFLKDFAVQYRFRLEKLDALTVDNINVSSTQIRAALQEGDIDLANEYLGYQFTLHGSVVTGQQLGRRIQFPTANIEASDPNKIIPGYGVYAVRVRFNGSWYVGMLNIGTRPTVNNNADQRSIEVHLLHFNEDIYGREVEICFFHKIREEQKFASVDALKAQLEKDKIQVASYFSLM